MARVRAIWVSSPRMTILVKVKGRTIVEAAPIARKFVGQPFSHLINWMQKLGPVMAKELDNCDR